MPLVIYTCSNRHLGKDYCKIEVCCIFRIIEILKNKVVRSFDFLNKLELF